MKNLWSLLLFSCWLISCSADRSASELQSQPLALTAACENEIKATSLQARLNFCKLSVPSAVAVTACLNNTFSKLPAISETCRPSAAKLTIEAMLPLLSYEAESLGKSPSSTLKTSFDDVEWDALVRNLDILFTASKHVNDKDVYLFTVERIKTIEDKLIQSLHVVKSAQALVAPTRKIFDQDLASVLGLNAKQFASVQASKNIEVVMPLVNATLATYISQFDFYASVAELYCGLGKCDSGWSRYQEVIALFSRMDAPEAFVAAFKNRRNPSAIDSILGLLNDRSAQLSSILPVTENYASAADFASYVRSFQAIKLRLEKANAVKSRLQFGLDEGSRTLIASQLKELQQKTKTALDNTNATDMLMYQKALEDIQKVGQSESLKATMESKWLQINRLAEDTLALQQNLTQLDIDRNRYILNFDALQPTMLGQDDKVLMQTEQSTRELNLSQAPASGKYPSTVNDSIAAFAAGQPIELQAGETLSLQVNGQWSPVCALLKSEYAADLNGSFPLIGPRGYMLAQANGKIHIEGRTVFSGKRHGSSETSTDSQNVGISFPAVFNVGLNHNDSQSSSQSKEGGVNNSTTDQSIMSSTAAFEMGLRLPTPFPQFPGGAVLAFRVPIKDEAASYERDTLDSIDAVFGVDSNITLSATTKSRIYFIINDCGELPHNVIPSQQNLQLEYTRYTLGGSVEDVKTAFTAMDEVIRKVEADANSTIKEGGAFQAKMATSQSAAQALLSSSKLTSKLSPRQRSMFMDYFQSFVEYIYGKAQRQLEIRQNTLQIAVMKKDLESYEKLLNSEEEKQRLRNLETIKMSNNYHLHRVYTEASDLMSFLSNQAFPLLKLYYPLAYRQVIKELRSDTMVDDSADLNLMIGALGNLAESVSKSLTDINRTLTSQRITIALSFPKPGLDRSMSDLPRDIPTASQEISKVLWDMVFRGKIDTSGLDIKPDYLYEALGSRKFNRFGLNCTMTAPVIDNAEVFLFTSSGSLSSADYSRVMQVDVQMGPDLLLPTQAGPQVVSLDQAEWGQSSLRTRIVNSNDFNIIESTISKDNVEGLQAGRGLSPFANFSVTDGLDLENAGFVLDGQGYPEAIDAITLAFLVTIDKAPKGTNRWMIPCADTAGTP